MTGKLIFNGPTVAYTFINQQKYKINSNATIYF